MENKLTGHGPSKARLVSRGNTTYVVKDFPITEKDRVIKEVAKMAHLHKLAKNIDLFRVPEVLEVNEFSYTMEYIQECRELNDVYPIMRTDDVCNKLIDISTIVSNEICPISKISVYEAFLNKFKAVKTQDIEYTTVIQNLPKNVNIPAGSCHGDLTFDNILVDKNFMWYLIDPVWSEAESPLWDIGKIFQSTFANWANIKSQGVLVQRSDKLNEINNQLLDRFSEKYTGEAILLATACQLSRVARWCFADTLLPIATKLLTVYNNGDASHDRCISALRGAI